MAHTVDSGSYVQPDTGQDVTTDLQSFLDAVGVGKYATLRPGTYLATGLTVAPGFLLDADGATIKVPGDQPNFTRCLTLTAPPAAAYDYAVTKIIGLTLDGNKEAHTGWQAGQKGQNSLLFAQGDNTAAGRLPVELDGVTVRGSVGDGITARYNVNAQLRDFTATACYRGGLTVSGSHTVVGLHRATFDGDDDLPGYINVEADAAGFTDRLDIDSSDVSVDGKVEMEARGGGSTTLREWTTSGGFWLLAPDGTFRAYDSTFGTDGGANRRWIYRPQDAEFVDCVFNGQGDDGDGRAVIHYYPNISGSELTDRLLTFRRCTFNHDTPGADAIRYYTEDVERGSKLVLVDSVRGLNVTNGVVLNGSGASTVEGSLA